MRGGRKNNLEMGYEGRWTKAGGEKQSDCRSLLLFLTQDGGAAVMSGVGRGADTMYYGVLLLKLESCLLVEGT